MFNLRDMFFAVLLLTAFAVIGAVLTGAAGATDCPPGAKSCKVLTLTPEEEQILVQPNNGVFATAEQGRFLELSQIVKYFRDKIAQAPAGTPAAPPAPVPPPTPAPEKPAPK